MAVIVNKKRQNDLNDSNIKNALECIKNEETIICRAFSSYRKKHSRFNIMGIYKELSESTGLSIRTIRRIISKQARRYGITGPFKKS
jgi:hypothetical protein